MAHTLQDKLTEKLEEGVNNSLSAALSDKDAACSNGLAVCSLNTQSLGFAVTAVLGRTNTLFVCEEL